MATSMNNASSQEVSDAPAQGLWNGKIFDGQWRDASGGTQNVLEKATGTTLATIGIASADDVARAAAPALALGNAVLLKPDVQAPVSGGALIAQLFEEAGLPPGVLHILPGDAETGEALVLDRNVNMIAFTGSTAVARRVGELAGRGLKRVSLELGGNNAYIVLDDADVEKAVAAGAFGSYFFQGQICFTAGRHLVH